MILGAAQCFMQSLCLCVGLHLRFCSYFRRIHRHYSVKGSATSSLASCPPLLMLASPIRNSGVLRSACYRSPFNNTQSKCALLVYPNKVR
ncbi:hypothetical protein BKA69DRAFT_1102543 [Paraphysoderma sedebokerense]|nr:hypothetical protein BKA69DRAFT_1102543 [Paraphysoderma sedebokerense]